MTHAFVQIQNGQANAIISDAAHPERDEVLMAWLRDDTTEMIIRVPNAIARKALFEPLSTILDEMGIPQ